MKKIFTILSISAVTSISAQTVVVNESFPTNGPLNTLGWTTHSGTIPGQIQVT